MNEDLNQREQLSALMDGELQGEEWLQALQSAEQGEGRVIWQAYHVVGDVLRSPELAAGALSSSAFLAHFNERLAREPAPTAIQPLSETVTKKDASVGLEHPQAANASVFRWKMLAGFASLAVVASVGWNSWDRLVPGDAQTGTQLAVSAPAVSPVAAAVPPVMIRDPRLDELLAAHRQFGSTSALQMPAGFLRNATFDAPVR